MKKLTTYVGLVALTFGVSAFAEFWPNRPNVVRAAQVLVQEVEHLDDALHNVSAPTHVIQKVHHFEETVNEFLLLAQTGTYQEAYTEYQHIRADIVSIRTELQSHPQLLSNPAVYREWRATWTAYRSVDHEMFQWNTVRWTPERVAELKKDLAELEANH